MKLSILTATYNREKYLKRLYESIINNQNYGLEAEWIIIDDGSIDRTKSLVEYFILENKLDIKYIYQKNSGKMSAINLGANMATGELLIDCDSDDFFSDNAFEIIYRNSDKLLSNREKDKKDIEKIQEYISKKGSIDNLSEKEKELLEKIK